MAHHIVTLTMADRPPEISAPAADRLLSGAPEFRTWPAEERDPVFAGIWQSTPGKWRVVYTEWEYFRILSGVSVLTEDGGAPRTLRAGDSLILRPGFRGTWEVIETTTKDYVVVV